MIAENLYTSEYITNVIQQVSRALPSHFRPVYGLSLVEAVFRSTVQTLDANKSCIDDNLYQAAMTEIGVSAEAHLGVFSWQIPLERTKVYEQGNLLTFLGPFTPIRIKEQEYQVKVVQRRHDGYRPNRNLTSAFLLLETSPMEPENNSLLIPRTSFDLHCDFKRKFNWVAELYSSYYNQDNSWEKYSALSEALYVANLHSKKVIVNPYKYRYWITDPQQINPFLTKKRLWDFNDIVAALLNANAVDNYVRHSNLS